MSSIRLLIADDRSVTRSGLIALARRSPALAIAGEAHDLEETVRAVNELMPDVVLLNLRDVPGSRLPELIRKIDGTAVVVLRSAGADVTLRSAIDADVAGYADLEAIDGELAEIIGIVNRGCSVYVTLGSSLREAAPEIDHVADTGDADLIDALTRREREVLERMASGASNRSIAASMNLSESTVKKHGTHILRKLSVQTRLEAAVIYRQAERSAIGPGTFDVGSRDRAAAKSGCVIR